MADPAEQLAVQAMSILDEFHGMWDEVPEWRNENTRRAQLINRYTGRLERLFEAHGATPINVTGDEARARDTATGRRRVRDGGA